MGVCVPHPSPLGPYPRPSALVDPWPPKYCKNKFMNKANYLFKIKTLNSFKIFKGPSYGVQNKCKGFSSQ